MEPEKLQDSIPKFKPWISSIAWGHWEYFLEFDLVNLSRFPDDCYSSYCWPLLVLQAASDRRIQLQVTPVKESRQGDELEEMLDEERVPVELYTYNNMMYRILQIVRGGKVLWLCRSIVAAKLLQ